MRTLLAIVRRDLVRFARNPTRTLPLFAIPLVLAFVFVVTFGGSGGEEGGVTVRVLVHDADGGIVAAFLQGASGGAGQDGALEIIEVGPEEGRARIEEGGASAFVMIPEGFSEAVLGGEPTTIRIVKNPAERFLPQLVEEGLIVAAALLSEASRVAGPELARLEELLEADETPSPLDVAALASDLTERVNELDGLVLPPVVEYETSVRGEDEPGEESGDDGAKGDDEASASPRQQVLQVVFPGIAMLGLLFVAQSLTRDLVRERETGLLRQLLSAPVTPFSYLAAKCASIVALSSAGLALLLTIGALIGVEWGSLPLLALVVVASGLACGGFLLALCSFAKSERQADAVTTIVIMVAAALGGAFFPISQMPDFMLPAAHLSVVFWSTSALHGLANEGHGIAELAPELAVLCGAGLVLLLIGARIMAHTMARGGR